MIVEFVGSGARDTSSPWANTSRLYNCWGEKVEAGGRAQRILRPVLGMEAYATTADVFIRDMFDLDGTVYAAAGDNLYQVASGLTTNLGSIVYGDANFSRNYANLTLTSGGKYYVWDGTTLVEPAAGAFSSFGSVDFLAGRTLLTEKAGSKIQWSDLADPNTLPGLNVASAGSRSDAIIRGLVSGGLYYVLGEKSTEIWGATGNGGASAFALLPGMVRDVGLAAFGLVCRVDGGLFLVGNDGIVYLAAGTTFTPVSIAPVATAIKDGTPVSCLYWEDRGHKFAAIVFEDLPAWVYAFTTGEWFERGEGVDYLPWRARVSVKSGDWLVGAEDGGIYTLTGLEDAGNPLLREATAFPVYADGAYFSVPEMEVFASSGAADASVMLTVCKDGIWQLPRAGTLSRAGQDRSRALFRGLGRAREFTFKVGVSDPVDVPLWSAARLRTA